MNTKPIYIKENNTILYGYYPNKVVNDLELINKLDELSENTDNTIFELDNELYEKFLAWPYDPEYTFNDGTIMERCKYYWFKYEPIIWDILDKKDNICYVKTHEVLINHCFDLNEESYLESDILKYLNKSFYRKAFPFDENYLQYSEENKGKLFLLSVDDCKLETFNTEELRSAKPTEYALANGCFLAYRGFSRYWLKDANERFKYEYKVVDEFGSFCFSEIYFNYIGVVIAGIIKIDIDNDVY